MEKQIMWGALVALGGWLWFYLLLRQMLFTIFSALPLISRFRKAGDGTLMTQNATRYAWMTIIVWILICGGIAAAVIHFAKLYLWVSFLVGAALALVMFVARLTPATKSNFNAFCSAYFKFVPDDELRTAMYNNKISEIKVRLDEMGMDKKALIPEFKHER